MPFSGFQDFNPDFSDALQQMIAARPGISVYSGYRTDAHQAELWANKLAELGGNVAAARRVVAPPIGVYGSKGSRHTHGIAADLAFASAEDKAWAHSNAEKFGLNFRMGHEPWHIEPLKTDGANVHSDSSPTGSDDSTAASRLPPRPEEKPTPIAAPKPLTPNTSFQLEPLDRYAASDLDDISRITTNKRAERVQELLRSIRDYNPRA